MNAKDIYKLKEKIDLNIKATQDSMRKEKIKYEREIHQVLSMVNNR